MRNKKEALKFAICFSGLSFIILGMVFVTIEHLSEKPQLVKSLHSTDFNLKRMQKPQLKRKIDPRTKRQKKVSRRFKALKPALNANFSGSDFGLKLGTIGELDLDRELLDGDKDVAMDEKSVDQRPRFLEKPSIEFPEKALSDNILKGVVSLRMLITKEGRVEGVDILSAVPKGYFEEVTLAMVSLWRFQPARYRGRPVAMWAKQVVRFGE